MNQLSVANQNAIIVLAERGWSHRRIARELGIHRETVGRYIRLSTSENSKPANVTAGSDPKPAKVTAGSGGARSLCEPHRAEITEKCEQGLSAQRIWQDLREDHGFDGSYESTKRFVRHLRQTSPLPFRRLETDPGEEAQIDFGQGAPFEERRRRRPHLFRIVLSHCRKGYSEVVDRQTTENFIRAIENAFWHFGGSPKVLIIDNLRAAVKKADWFDPELNPKIESFSRHYGVIILPTRPYTPRHKGKVEAGVDYVQENALKGRSFEDLTTQNAFLHNWEANVADTRIHGTTRQQVRKVYEEIERPALQPLPRDRFPFFHEGERRVHRDGHVEVKRAYYSVPPEYVGRKVWVRWDSRLVRIFTERMEPITVHCRREAGRFATKDEHISSRKRSAVERSAEDLLSRARRIGPETGGWGQAMLEARGIPGIRVLVGLLSLAKRHPVSQLESACATARKHHGFRLQILRELMKRQKDPSEPGELLREHPIIRDLSTYGDLITQRSQP